MKIKLFGLLFAALLFAQGASAQQRPCTADSLKSWLHFLASDEMKGRENGTEEIEKVAAWLSEKYKRYGLRTFSGLDGFIQPYILYGDSSFVHKNVVGYIPAKRKKNNSSSFVVVSAHFDHIGMSHYPVNGDSIYNGADDNASGVAAMLAIAKNLHEHEIKPDFPIVFVAFSNEETGLIGSGYFCSSGVIPNQKIKANINLEMLGRSGEFGRNKYYITGPNFSNFQDVIVKFNENKGWEIADVGRYAERYFSMSDNWSFVRCAARESICFPAHTIATSLGAGYLHQVNDEVQYLDFENFSNLVENLTQIVLHIADKNVEVECR